MNVTCGSNVGLVRTNNEDSYICMEPYVYAVADGMGGHAAGEVASKLLIEEVKKDLKNDDVFKYNEEMLKQIIIRANNVILQKSAADEALAGMGTTASLILLQNSRILWAHIGDSRIYYMHESKLVQITTDHSLVDMWVKNGTITAEEALHHPQKNILTRAVGVENAIEVDTGEFSILPGDKVLLSTDGLTNMVEDKKIREILLDETINNKADVLLHEALENGGLDNITAIVVEF
ncbi:Stp1/IreP family PP2C-type Ser/Thr phosphatase [Pectinatus sottacetonis]|uniref:Stp1/IreP family PP2C-type Ser/Thr phosphatase n=1 Tax=Pectinatus sottacetonis TaxID=1002795 RepID=UPI002EDB359D